MDCSLEVKLGQMVVVGFRGATRSEYGSFLEQFHDLHLGGVWLTDNESPMGHTLGNIQSPDQVRQLTTDLRQASEIPPFIAIDAEGGQVIRLKERYGFPKFPSARALGDMNDVHVTRAHAGQIARTLHECGINFNFSPVLDVNVNPDNPIIGRKERSYSSSAEAVALHATAVIEAHHEQGILCAGKHFPGHGSSLTDSHKGLVDITDTWNPSELLPYRLLIQNGLLDAVLSAHVFLRQYDPVYPATLSDKIMTGILRQELQFGGIVFTDDLNMGAIHQNYSLEQSVELCIQAGADVVLHANVDQYDPQIAPKTVAILKQLVSDNKISEERIDESFRRIMQTKDRIHA